MEKGQTFHIGFYAPPLHNNNAKTPQNCMFVAQFSRPGPFSRTGFYDVLFFKIRQKIIETVRIN
jgi:hypothetical protein